jgi:hypothetical protein
MYTVQYWTYRYALRVDEESDTDLVMADGQIEGLDDGSRLAFNWRETDRRYRRAPKADKPAHRCFSLFAFAPQRGLTCAASRKCALRIFWI